MEVKRVQWGLFRTRSVGLHFVIHSRGCKVTVDIIFLTLLCPVLRCLQIASWGLLLSLWQSHRVYSSGFIYILNLNHWYLAVCPMVIIASLSKITDIAIANVHTFGGLLKENTWSTIFCDCNQKSLICDLVSASSWFFINWICVEKLPTFC